MFVNEKLESLCQTWLTSMPFGERTHQLRMVDNESWVDTILLDEFSNKFVNKSGSRSWITAVDIMLNAELVKQCSSLLRLEILASWKLDSHSFL